METVHESLRPSAVEAIGNTPLVELTRYVSNRGVSGRILAKLDNLNPGYSKKDRIARQMIEDAEASGELKSGQTVVEATSGNTGTGLAIVCAVKGYSFVAVMSRGNSMERARMMRSLGAEVVLVGQSSGSRSGEVSGADLALVWQETLRIVVERNAFRADQFKLTANRRAHLLHTGPEILRASDGKIDGFCDFVGSGGTFAGCAEAFKQHNTEIACFVVEPSGAAVLAGEPADSPNHRIQGGGYCMGELEMIDRKYIDGFLTVTEEEAREATRQLAKEEGIFGGYSSGANVAAAAQLLRGAFAGKTIAVLICDSGLKYLSTDLWGD